MNTKISTAITAITGTPAITTPCQFSASSIPHTIIGATASPTFPVERCNPMNNPRLCGYISDSSAIAGGCHKALPADATMMDTRIT